MCGCHLCLEAFEDVAVDIDQRCQCQICPDGRIAVAHRPQAKVDQFLPQGGGHLIAVSRKVTHQGGPQRVVLMQRFDPGFGVMGPLQAHIAQPECQNFGLKRAGTAQIGGAKIDIRSGHGGGFPVGGCERRGLNAALSPAAAVCDRGEGSGDSPTPKGSGDGSAEQLHDRLRLLVGNRQRLDCQ